MTDTPLQGTRLREVAPGAALGVAAGDCVVCIPVFGGTALFLECLGSVLRHTPAGTTVVVADDAHDSGDAAVLLRRLAADDDLPLPVVYTRQPRNLGFVGNVNTVFAMAAPADVVILNSDCVVGAGWLEGLRDAAFSDATIATVTPLTNHGTLVSVPHRNTPQPALPQSWTVDQAAAAVRRASPRLRPRLPTAIGHCMYIRRTALDLVGGFDESFSPGYGEEVDFSRRCIGRGLVNVAADDVFVMHQGGGSFAARPGVDELRKDHDRIIAGRYPEYGHEVETAALDRYGPLARSLGAARRALVGMSVTIDGECLGPFLTGTQLHTLEVIGALARTEAVRLRVVLPPNVGDYAQDYLSALPRVETVAWAADLDLEPTDIAHRPFQVGSAMSLAFLRRMGDRVVITHQDLIAYRHPQYHANVWGWQQYRRSVRDALGLADAVACFSQYVADDVVAEGLVDRSRCFAVPIGVDHRYHRTAPSPRPPRDAELIEGREAVLCIGADFRHKNRVFAMAVAERLRSEHGWDGVLVLAGPRVEFGSSAGEEAEYLMRHPDAACAVVRLPAVSEAEKAWLYERARLVLYPTTIEGFGLVPFEVAEAGIPCLFAPQSSLAEVLPGLGRLTSWDPSAAARTALTLLRDERERAALVEATRKAGARYRWDATATALLEIYAATADAMPRVTFGHDVYDPDLTTVGRELVGHGGLPADVQNALHALVRRQGVGRPVLAGFASAYRAARRASAIRRARLGR
ncbi:MAG TPA: glycosyltransferase [Candidatus Dormibacteraeota bacterium]|nr:glycosyltransferase [Candidatus Dormibacteraeota bacterium]